MTDKLEDLESPPKEFTELLYWDRGLYTAKMWYREEWEGSYIQWCLARDIAKAIEAEFDAAAGFTYP